MSNLRRAVEPAFFQVCMPSKFALAFGVAALSSVACMTIKEKSSSPLRSESISVRLGGGSPSGIYRFDFANGKVDQVVTVEPTSELIKFSFIRVSDETHFYLIGDQAGQRNLYRAAAPSDGSATASPTKILGNDDLNGPTICDAGQNLLFGQVTDNAVQVLKTPISSTSTTVAFHRPNFLAGDLHCRPGIDGFFFSGFDCPAGGNLGNCLTDTNADSIARVFHVVDGQAKPISAPDFDSQVTALPRPKLFHRGDVDAAATKLSSGSIVLGFSRIFDSPLLGASDAPQHIRDIGYQKLMVSVVPSDTSSPAETEINLSSYFRQHWQLPGDVTIDYVNSTIDLRERSDSSSNVEFLTKASIAKRGATDDDGHKFDGIVFGRFATTEIGKPKADLLEMRGLLTMQQFSCGIWRSSGLGDSDGNVYLYGMIFPRFADHSSTTLYFSTQRHPIGPYVADGGGGIKLADGTIVPADAFLNAFCGS